MQMQLTRGEFLRLTVGASFATGLLARFPASLAAQSSIDERISRAIAEYDAQGIHRTATGTDNASGEWLRGQAEQAGAAARLESFDLDRVDVDAAYVESDGRRIDGLPFFDGAFTNERGVLATLGPPEAARPLALVTLTAAAISTEGQSLSDLRRSGRFEGIVAVTNGAHAGLSPSNAAAFANPYGTPVLQVSSEEGAWLEERSRLQHDVRFVANAVRTPTRGSNVVAVVAGRQPNLTPVVVMTPRSGWWHCAGERGGGIACWLEIIRVVAAKPGERTLLCVASSGHELGHFGLDRFIERRPGLIKDAAAWIHLGADVGAAGGAMRLQSSDEQIEAIANASLARANAVVAQHVPRGTVPGGEARNIHVGGGRYVSLLGGSPFFHNLADRWPDAVNVTAVAQFAAAVSDVATTLTASR
jgi:hypothetical protein